MQKTPLTPLSESFRTPAAITEELRLRRRVDKLPESAQDEHYKNCENARRSLDNFKEDLAAEREANIEFEKQAILDRDYTEHELKLKPKNLPTISEAERYRQVEERAKANIQVEENKRLEEAATLLSQSILDSLESLEIKQEHLRAFEESSRIGFQDENGKDDFER